MPVRPLHLLCVGAALALAVYIHTHDASKAAWLLIFSILIAGVLHAEQPGPGRGVGQAALPLPGLTFLPRPAMRKRANAGIPPPPLGDGGALLKDHAYCIVFFTVAGSCTAKLPKAHKLAKTVHAGAGDWFHTVLVSRSAREQIQRVSSAWSDCATPIAHDSEDKAFLNYMAKHSTFAVPQAFVVDRAGVIVWHGHINRKDFGATCAELIRQHAKEKSGSSGEPQEPGRGEAEGGTNDKLKHS